MVASTSRPEEITVTTRTRTITVCAAVTVAGLAVGIAVPATAATPAARTAAIPAVYQGKTVNQHFVLGPQSSPTLLTSTPRLPAGTYLVTAIAGAVIASHDQIVCAAYTGADNDGVFGTVGNPGTGSIYGTATMSDTVKVAAGQRINVSCNSFNYGLGTWAGEAVIEAIPVARVD
jgi:hypothetical protein